MSGHDEPYLVPPEGGFNQAARPSDKKKIQQNVAWLKAAFAILLSKRITPQRKATAEQCFRIYWVQLPGNDLPNADFKPASQSKVNKMPWVSMMQIMYVAIEWLTAVQGFGTAWTKGKPDIPSHLQGSVSEDDGEEEEEEDTTLEPESAIKPVSKAVSGKRAAPGGSSSGNSTATKPAKKAAKDKAPAKNGGE